MRVEMDHVWRSYRVGDDEIVALRDASVSFESGELVAVVGPSGSGKSTFLQLIGLLDSPTAGDVLVIGLLVLLAIGGVELLAATRTRPRTPAPDPRPTTR